VLLARLAVDRTQQGHGLGKALLFDALTRVAEAADIVGVRAVLVHAIDAAARSFYIHFGFEESPVDPNQLLRLLKDLRKAIRGSQPGRNFGDTGEEAQN
jgi:GNAT superfamily N-acetyltransferase